jgi:hypothetical protein
VELTTTDPYATHCRATVLEAGPERAVVEQPADPEVDNHVKVRHASALYTAAFEAARQLVLAALGDRAADAEVKLADSEIAYTQVGLGMLTSTAEPAGGDWAKLDAEWPIELDANVVTTDPEGKSVVTLTTRWSISRRR